MSPCRFGGHHRAVLMAANAQFSCPLPRRNCWPLTVLRLWLRGEGYRGIDRLSGVDRKTVRRYVEAAIAAGLSCDGGEEQLTDVVIGLVCDKVRPARPTGHGAGWESLVPHEEEIKAWLAKDLKLVKVQDLLARKGTVVAYRTLNRFATQRCGFGQAKTTVRVADGEPGSELQVDFGRMGLVPDPVGGGRRMVQALIFTACWSRHCFVWLSHRRPPPRSSTAARRRGHSSGAYSRW